MVYHIITKNDINDRLNDIQSVLCGIGKPKQLVVPQKQLSESYSEEHQNDTINLTKHIVRGEDYHKELHELHKFVKPYVKPGSEHNAEDNYIYDVLKKGKPSGATISHVLDVIHEQKGIQTVQNHQYLKHKWIPFLEAHARVQPLITDMSDAGYTQREINELPKKFKVRSYRVIEHPTNQLFEMHPTEGIRYLGSYNHPHLAKFTHKKSAEDTSWANTDKTLSDHYKKFPSNEISQYTRSSVAMNLHLHGILNPSEYDENDMSTLHRHSHAITAHLKIIPHPTNHPDFHVYTGLHWSADPGKINERTEDGHILFKSPAFVSTSLDRSIAQDFASPKTTHDINGRSVSDILKIHVPGGYSRGMYVKPFSGHADEHEYLLDKNHTFLVHPEPTYYAIGDSLHRQWNANIHYKPKKQDWESLITNEKIRVALDPNTDKVMLNRASLDSNPIIRAAAAKHPNIDPYDHERLMTDHTSIVKEASMMNPKLPGHLMERASLSNNKHFLVGLAKNPKIDYLTKLRLTQTSIHPAVGNQLAKRHDLEPEIIDRLLYADDEETHKSLARNTSLHHDDYDTLLNNDNPEVLRELAKNSSISKTHINRLLEHPNPVIRQYARSNSRNWKLE